MKDLRIDCSITGLTLTLYYENQKKNYNPLCNLKSLQKLLLIHLKNVLGSSFLEDRHRDREGASKQGEERRERE